MEFTDEMLEQLAASCAGRGLPVYLDEREPEIDDPARQLADHHWKPACKTTTKLTRCLEAIRDVATAIAPITTAGDPEKDKRLVKQAVLPTYNLAVALRDLYNDILSNHSPKLGKDRQKAIRKRYEKFGEIVPTAKGALKDARDKIAAHLDKDSFTFEYRQFWEAFSLADVLRWIRGCMRLLEVLIPPDIYSWTRASGYSNVVNLMNVDGSEVSLRLKDGEPTDLLGMKFAVSPKAGIIREARALAGACAALEQRMSIKVPEPRMSE
jgi:hypothetical protein